jgi:hypothetical protein
MSSALARYFNGASTNSDAAGGFDSAAKTSLLVLSGLVHDPNCFAPTLVERVAFRQPGSTPVRNSSVLAFSMVGDVLWNCPPVGTLEARLDLPAARIKVASRRARRERRHPRTKKPLKPRAAVHWRTASAISRRQRRHPLTPALPPTVGIRVCFAHSAQ